MLERDFKKKVRKEFMDKGWIFIQLVAGAGVPEGFPDTLCISPLGYSCYVEWKKEKNAKKRPLQDYWNKQLNKMGHDAFFVYPENVEEWKQHVINRNYQAHAISVARAISGTTGQ
jgi:hypothetical protein